MPGREIIRKEIALNVPKLVSMALIDIEWVKGQRHTLCSVSNRPSPGVARFAWILGGEKNMTYLRNVYSYKFLLFPEREKSGKERL